MPTPTDILLKRVEVLIDQERYDLAEKELRKLLAENPEHADVVANLVRTLTGAAKNTEAREWALKLLALDPNRAYFYYLAAFVEVRLRLFDEAETHIRRAIALEPEWAMNFEVLSRVYQHRGKYQEGLAFANEGLRLDPDHIDCLDARAFSLAMLGRKDEARHTIEHALSLEPENPYLRRDIGVAFSHLGDYHSAETHLRETLRLDPTYGDAQTQLGKAIRQKQWVFSLSEVMKNKLTQRDAAFVNETADAYYKLFASVRLVSLLVFVGLACNYFVFSAPDLSVPKVVYLITSGLFAFVHMLTLWHLLCCCVYFLFRIVTAPLLVAGNVATVLHPKHKHLFTPEEHKIARNQRVVLILFPLLSIVYGIMLRDPLFTIGLLAVTWAVCVVASLRLQKL
jgi:tetratricopeptide (TPR) repeat protein